MWMMGYNECGGEFNMTDSCTGRKLRPLIPRPNNTCNRLNGSDIISLNHHLASVTDQTKREFNTQPVVVSSRWNPTPEQLRTLEELYRRGTRTPTADQIQQITAQLRRYGKIEGKNVFYWFQNHKARERQKRRRQMESCPDNDQHGHDADIFERKESGGNRTDYEVDQTKIWVPSTNCSTLSEEVGSMQRAAKAVGAAESYRAASDGWMQFDDGGLVFQHQHRRNIVERNATWQMMQSSCPPPTYHHLINNTNNITSTTTSSTCTTTTTSSTSMAATTAPSTTTILPPSPKLINSSHDQYFNIFIAPYIENGLISDEDGCGGESQTLQLFPLRSCGGDGNNGINEKETNAAMNANFITPYQFFEFLPMKN